MFHSCMVHKFEIFRIFKIRNPIFAKLKLNICIFKYFVQLKNIFDYFFEEKHITALSNFFKRILLFIYYVVRP